MSSAAGFAGQLMIKSEVTPGTAVTPDISIPFVSEGVKQDIQRIPSKGIRAGRRTLAKWAAGTKKIGGDIKFELGNAGFATLLKHCFGTVVTTGAGPYVHTLTPGPIDGKAFTSQVGRPDTSGTVQPFTWAGTKVASWALSASVGSLAEFTVTVTAQSETTATALATASYASGYAPFTFVHGAASIAGSSVGTVRQFNLNGVNGLADDRFRVGSATVKEQLEAAVRAYTGTITTDFDSLTAYARFTAGTETAVVLTFTNGTDSFVVTMNVEFDGESPAIGSADELLEQPLPFTCVSGTSDAAAITAVYTSSIDVTAA